MAELKDVNLPGNAVVRSNVSRDKQAVSVQIQSVMVELTPRPKPQQGGTISVGGTLADPPLVATQTTTLFVEYGADAPAALARVRITGLADLQPGVRAVLVSRIAGATVVDEFTADGEKDFDRSHTVSVPAGPGIPITFVLLADRTFADGALPGALVNVDALDLSLDGDPPVKGKV